jgi:hypothetical protein
MPDMEEPQEKPQGVITLGSKQLSPEQEADYRAKIQNAKKGGINAHKGNTPVGHVEKPTMPLLRPTGAAGEPAFSTDIGSAPGVKPRPPGSPVLRPGTISQLEGLQEAQKKAAETQSSTDEAAMKEELESTKQEELLEAFDFSGQTEAERILENKKRRKEIEDRLEPMKLEDLIMRDEVRQKIPIIPDKYEILFRSVTPQESLFVKQYLYKEQMPNDSYALEKYSICMLVCALLSINGKSFPDHRKTDGAPDEKLFEIKMKDLMRKSAYIVADLGVQYRWFDMRVRRLMNPDSLGNG